MAYLIFSLGQMPSDRPPSTPRDPFRLLKSVSKMIAWIKKWHICIDRSLASISAGLVLFMMALGTVDVLSRYLLNSPISGSYEIMKFSLGGMAFFAFSYVQYERGHISVSFIQDRLSKKTSAVFDLIFLFAMLLTFMLVAWYGGRNAVEAWQEGDTTIGMVELPIGPAKMVVPIGGGLLCLRILSQIWTEIAALIEMRDENRGGS